MRGLVAVVTGIAIVCCALLAAGCGSADRVEYERELAKIGRSVDESLDHVRAGDDEQIGPEEVSGIADDLREAADQLDDLDPPKDAKAAQARLVRGLRGVAKAFDQLAKDLQHATTATAEAELFVRFTSDEQVNRSFDDIVEAQEAYARNGYRVFGTKRKALTTSSSVSLAHRE